MKIKVSEASGPVLDWMVAMATGEYRPVSVPKYSTDWSQGGPIIERELLVPEPELDHNCKCFRWCCRNWTGDGGYLYGTTPLIAAMRCYVASELGDEVEVPDELL